MSLPVLFFKFIFATDQSIHKNEDNGNKEITF